MWHEEADMSKDVYINGQGALLIPTLARDVQLNGSSQPQYSLVTLYGGQAP